MLLAFVDETSDAKYPDYFGLCVVTINAAHYRAVKEAFQNVLSESGWDPTVEFKGSFLFSASKGCKNVPVDTRVEIASQLLDLTASVKNARIKFHYFRAKATDPRATYLGFLPSLLQKSLPKAEKKHGKDLLYLHCDRRDDLEGKMVRDAVSDAIARRGYTLVEDVVMSTSGYHTVGVLYADLVGYLMGRIDTISVDSELFENISQQEYAKNGKLRKLQSSKDLIGKIKRLETYVVKVK